MSSVNQNDSFYANNKRTFNFTITDRDVTPNIPYDLTGKHVRWSLSRQQDDGSYSSIPLLEKTTADTSPVDVIINADPTTGKVQVILQASDTIGLLGKYHHELEVIDGAGQAVVVATGTILILKNIVNS